MATLKAQRLLFPTQHAQVPVTFKAFLSAARQGGWLLLLGALLTAPMVFAPMSAWAQTFTNTQSTSKIVRGLLPFINSDRKAFVSASDLIGGNSDSTDFLPAAVITLNKTGFRTNESIIDMTTIKPGSSTPVTIFLGVILPGLSPESTLDDVQILSFTEEPGGIVFSISNEPVPFKTGVTLTALTTPTVIYKFTGGEPRGKYITYAIVISDAVMTSENPTLDDVGSLSIQTFTFIP